jgi:phosphatidylserine decarboxylase
VNETVSLVLQGGAITVFLMGFGALLSGRIRTRQEVESVKEVQKERFTRAEAQFDTIIPLIQQLIVNQQKQTDLLADLIEEIKRG